VKEQLDADVAMSVIEEVRIGKLSAWCHRIVNLEKLMNRLDLQLPFATECVSLRNSSHQDISAAKSSPPRHLEISD